MLENIANTDYFKIKTILEIEKEEVSKKEIDVKKALEKIKNGYVKVHEILDIGIDNVAPPNVHELAKDEGIMDLDNVDKS